MAIPTNRPVIGADLEDLREKLGLTVDDARWVFGLTMNKFAEYIRQEDAKHGRLGYRDKPIPNPAVALLARLYDTHPELCPIPERPTPEDLLERMVGVTGDENMKHLSVMLGREAASAFRWLKRGGRTSPTVDRLATHLMQAMKRGKKGLSDWEEDLVEVEARARGIDDIWRVGRWTTPGEEEKDEV